MVWLALGVLPAFGQAGGGPIAPFAVYTRFEHEPAAPIMDALESELAAIMSPMGLRFEWRSLSAPRQAESFRQLAVVTFQGRCDLASLFPETIEPSALGWTHVTDGQVIPFADVDCDKTRAFLSRSLILLPPAERGPAFGRAVARVLAHELYHVFTRTRHHGSHGLAQASYTPPELLAVNFAFADADRQALAAVCGRPLAVSAGYSLFAAGGCGRCHGPRLEGTAQGPALRSAGRPVSADRLARQVSHASSMYHRAQELNLDWPTMAGPDMENLLAYLNAVPE